ncbi:MAG: Fe-S cluster domain-containing protein [Proteiniphilum sp.]|jgi:Na+-translocating ferredoxin:NAD+ oxidoreductase RNF subunit RnfB|nr:Fe-S cluster domain-containing protein [Proteiniphilum sp.]NCD14471.1 Fe-S cluster domain-containing protein [Bacteroidia bacterium]MDD2727274.1 Fe-S cluster domain-containing protein [Proteiniphilum sp.]MDD3332050.1 Fe-S cluster domain-containing protein [Proteiniphilum sp.]MDD3556294.1 Fe-S cluster domain-containing protein [Proteiniphilum sp.]
MSVILTAVATLGAIGAGSAGILYLISQKFKVEEDPRIQEVQDALPAANCGGCGFPGCAAFAAACVKAESLEELNCPVGGQETMDRVAAILGQTASKTAKKIAVVRCSGTCEERPRLNLYDGATNCSIAAALYGGDTGCSFGCLGLGDCEESCAFDAIHINPETMLPEVVEDKCTACGACVKACPKDIIELRKQGPKSRRIYVSCVNKDKGAAAKKACNVACIGCGKCQQVCPFDAITIENNLAYIDDDKCRLCRKCVVVCPTHSILELHFPPRKETPPPAKEEAANATA